MNIYYELTALTDKSVVLSIGNFDGVHYGHQKIFQKCREIAGDNGKVAIITFSNHPLDIVENGRYKVPLLSSPDHKSKSLEKLGIDDLFLLNFDESLMKKTSEQFLQEIRSLIPFSHLVIGYNACIGHDRQGTSGKLQQLAQKLDFNLVTVDAYCIKEQPISSSYIRQLVKEGDLTKVEKALGRKYSFYGKVCRGIGKGRELGFPTVNLNIEKLCYPPLGVYAITLKTSDGYFPGVANLGLAPTLRDLPYPILEAHLFDYSGDLYDQQVEIILHKFIRPEQKFANIEALQQQIAADLKAAKHELNL